MAHTALHAAPHFHRSSRSRNPVLPETGLMTRFKQGSASRFASCIATFLFLVVSGTEAAAPVSDDAMCNARSHFTTLEPVPTAAPAYDARAIGLNGSLIKWPGVFSEAQEASTSEAGRARRFRLYASASGAIVAVPGARVAGADEALRVDVTDEPEPEAVQRRFSYLGAGVLLNLGANSGASSRDRMRELHRGQLLLVQEDEHGLVVDATRVQVAGALDDLYADAAPGPELGVQLLPQVADAKVSTRFSLWAPTARAVSVCIHASGVGAATSRMPLLRDALTGVWSATAHVDLSGSSYTYLVDVFVPGVGTVRNRVTDPYSVSLDTDSQRSFIADLGAPALKPEGWDSVRTPGKVQAQTDMVIYELHVRDFSINDPSVSAARRGKYLAFTERNSQGMKHLRALADAGLTDVHLLPIFDFASVPEQGCVTAHPLGSADGTTQQAVVMAVAQRDCFNWGYDPWHYGAPEGSYASNAADGAARIREARAMVLALHQAGLRVGMDVVYNHTDASGQHPHSVLDRIVPGYYHRLNAKGVVERSTCCDNTATEHLMMARLMIDTVERWAVHYKIDSFRFDLMAHQPRAAMEALRDRVNRATGREVNLIGEGWNFGEVANGARFEQASQLSLNGSGIGTFSDRGRDAIRGGSAGDSGEALARNRGYVNGMVEDPSQRATLLRTADMVRVGLAGSLRSFMLVTHADAISTLGEIDYKGQPAGYVSQPGEVVNYVENHDNQTLFDVNVHRLPLSTTTAERARVQIIAAAINAFSQGVAYFHAGIDTLRSKSLDRNSFNSGDWFNRIDWRYRDNYFGAGAPPEQDNGASWPLMRPLLADARIKPTPADIAWTRDAFRDLLRIRASSSLFRMRSADDIVQRLHFHNTGSAQNPAVLVEHLDGEGLAGASFKEVLLFITVAEQAQTLNLPELAGKPWVLHPVQAERTAADQRVREAVIDAASGRFVVPGRTALVLVVSQ
jgi:pullulanase/glycogen debranching enzyme